jgi:hypothetical protein
MKEGEAFHLPPQFEYFFFGSHQFSRRQQLKGTYRPFKPLKQAFQPFYTQYQYLRENRAQPVKAFDTVMPWKI